MTDRTNYAKSIFILLVVLCFISGAAVLKLTASFFVPVTVAVLLAFVFLPLCEFLSKIKIPWVISVLLSIAIALVVLYVVGNLLITSISSILKAFPKYESRLTSLYQTFCQQFKIDYDENSSLLTNLWNSLNVRTAIQNIAITLSSSLVNIVKQLLVVGLFMAFLLIELRDTQEKIDQAFTEKKIRGAIKQITKKIKGDVTHYISIKFLISLLTGLLVYASCAVIKMDFPIIWGFTAFVLNFIPSFGSIVSWALTTIFALLQFYPNWGYVLFIAITVLAINMILGNIVEPRWEGADLGLSPFVILVSLSFWGWMWGFIGMILAVPLMVIIKIVCENINFLRPIAVLLGNKVSKTQEESSSKENPQESVHPLS